ncbi:nitrate- and nitrite sensing domain-containing protein [Catenovulum sp. 2E275]|uniref:nitrate- and nitrite sensing domain-containing protein n=1 Tax=Catenovulum sp. 2E275 TaxID=2980497 RepID=UPI0021CF8F42|nr:nitrate- and nitrite sensing domain-containing protein [Catenovulum sp. 2E275]MCU4675779.1 nitrate- and nitrite sensing domain-containing protein [Catenovulum sp. 2E275]
MTYLMPVSFVLFLVLGLMMLVLHTAKKRRSQQVCGIEQILLLRNLISTIQKHRGLSVAYIRGDKSVLSEIKQLVNLCAQISHQLAQNGLILKFEGWAINLEHWQRLHQKIADLTPEQSIFQHTQLIGNLLYLLEDMAEHYQLTSATMHHFPNIGLLWRELLQVSEYIGQARALGTGVATAKSCTRVEKIKLGFLYQKIEEVSQFTYQNFVNNAKQTEQSSMNQLKAAHQKIADLCQTIKCQMIESEQISLDAKQYFALATETMNAVNQVFDLEINKIKADLKNDI